MTYRNPKLLKLAQKAPKCFRCGTHNTGTVVACHSNSQKMGKGMGVKASDAPIAYLCHDCHDIIDGRAGNLGRMLAHLEWCEAAVLSMRWALEEQPEVFCHARGKHEQGSGGG